MATNEQFARSLVKGKIAETIFAQMLRETGQFTVLEFGYEKIVPELIQQGYSESNGLVETLRTAPDFAVINKEKREVRLIEVKYRRQVRSDDILKIAQRMHALWNPSYLFIASLEGFYFDEVHKIVERNGEIRPLKHPFISDETQQRYLQILIDFEQGN